jgi:hypothetical protein
MAWQRRITEILTDTLRLLARAALLINLIVLACASVYVCIRFSLRLLEYLDAKLFANPWG